MAAKNLNEQNDSLNPSPVANPLEGDASSNEQPTTPHSRWRGVKFAVKAVEIRLRFIAVLVGIGLLIGYWDTIRNYWDKWTRPESNVAAIGSDSEFYCPMHPNVVRDTLDPDGTAPECPICGMPLSKRKKGEAPELPAGVVSRVQLSPERVRMAGVETVPVSYRPLEKEIRTVGYVAYDESRLSKIVTRFSGYVEELYVDKTYATVTKDQPLAKVYSPELYTAAQEFRIAHQNGKNGSSPFIASAHEKLRLLGVSEQEIKQFHEQGKAEVAVDIRSPRDGQVVRKEIVDGSRIETGMTLFAVADLSAVWVEADVYEKDVPFLQPGRTVEATVEALSGQSFQGQVSLVYPELNSQTRTNRVRFEVQNPELKLRPGMYATVRITTPVSLLEPFRTAIAARHTAADASDADLIAAQTICPVTGAKLGSMGPPIKRVVDSQTVFICCGGCTDKLESSPEVYLAKIAPPPTDAVLAVPQSAVIDTGTQQVVYVEREPGVLEGVEVKLGPRAGEFYPVLSGLLPGDRVASAGAFLIDAETRLNPAAASAYFGASGGPSSGKSAPATPEPGRGPQPEQDGGDGSQPDSEELSPQELGEVTKLPTSDRESAREQRICPVTDLHLGSMGKPVKFAVQGKEVFLCCPGCEERLRKNPDKYIEKLKSAELEPVNLPAR